MEHGRFRTAITYGNPNQDIFGDGLGVLYKNIEIAVVIEDAGIQEFIFIIGRVRCRLDGTRSS